MLQHTLEELQLSRPASDLPSYVVVEGPIGVGKSTLAKSLSYSLNCDLLLERPEDNPFLSKFYNSSAAYALQTQLSFLFQRIRQLSEIQPNDLFGASYVSDFMLEKDALFAEATLDQYELELYFNVYEHVVKDTPTPDLVVYLQAPVSCLLYTSDAADE